MTSKELTNLIAQGETETVEFKQSFSRSVIETLVAFSNTRGGRVIIGVKNDKNILGVSVTEESVQQWINEIKQNTKPQIIPDTESVLLEEKEIVVFSIIEYPINLLPIRINIIKEYGTLII